jgi:hypothetical protein
MIRSKQSRESEACAPAWGTLRLGFAPPCPERLG